EGNNYTPGQLLRAGELEQFKQEENEKWKFVNIDANTGQYVVPKGSSGHRWEKENQGRWDMKLENTIDNKPYDPVLTFLEDKDETLKAEFTEFGLGKKQHRGVPVKYI
ncbi:MAG: hypothetical protein ABEH43_06655, partial [Flavobacteriales bacterium]